jgi:hypothetical protein
MCLYRDRTARLKGANGNNTISEADENRLGWFRTAENQKQKTKINRRISPDFSPGTLNPGLEDLFNLK